MQSKETPYYGNYIGGVWQTEGEMFSVFDKYTGEEIAKVHRSTREDVTRAIDSACAAFEAHKLPPSERYDILMRAVEIIHERQEELAQTIVREMGKVLKDARGEIQRGIQTFIASAEEAKRIAGRGIPLGQPGNGGRMAFTVRTPVGVIGAISPFNFPFNLVAHKVAPAIAAGNAVVLKPAELTPITSCILADILTDSGLPQGLLTLINGYGREAGQYLLEDERIAMYTFTGSPGVGRHIKSATGIRKVTLELGNNSPNIIHHDVPDFEQAVELCVTRAVSNAGQACISVQRVYVHRDIHDKFVERATSMMQSLQVGDPSDPNTDIGPMISEAAAKRAESWVEEAVSSGAKLVHGGQRYGAILQPTLLVDVQPSMKVVCEEVFAPVLTVMPYDDIDEAFRMANDSKFGLQVGLFTSDLTIALRAANELHFGGVIVNDVSTYRADVMPYGGVKDSGVGKEGPRYAIEEMTDERLVVINLK